MIDFNRLAQKYQTPLFIYDFDYMKEQYFSLKNAFKARKSLICYAIKANSNLSVIANFAKLGAGADCVSLGEIKRALRAGVEKYKIIFSGVGKSDSEIKEAILLNILLINIESEAEFLRVEMIAKELNIKARISIRVNPNVDPKTHPYISTGLHENKFGVEINTAKRMYLKAKNSPFLEPVGVHFHIGSQLTNLRPILESTEIVSSFLRELKALEIDIKFFDIGGGIGIDYNGEEVINLYDYVQGIFSSLSGLDVTVVCEPGRFIVGNGGYFLTKVLYEKINANKRFVIVDGAMNDLIRPTLYQAYHKIEVINNNNESSFADIVGPICESGDYFAKNRKIPKTNHNDLIVIYSVGAYGFTMSSNYNTRGRAAEIALENGEDRIIRKRESFEDLIFLEEEFIK